LQACVNCTALLQARNTSRSARTVYRARLKPETSAPAIPALRPTGSKASKASAASVLNVESPPEPRRQPRRAPTSPSRSRSRSRQRLEHRQRHRVEHRQHYRSRSAHKSRRRSKSVSASSSPVRRLLAVDLQEGIIIIAHPVRARAVDPVRVRAARQGIIVVIGILVTRRGRAQDRADATRTRTNRTLTDCTVCKLVARPRL
jgi:hypothetical protein